MWVGGGEEVHKKLISMERHLKCLENVSTHNYMHSIIIILYRVGSSDIR